MEEGLALGAAFARLGEAIGNIPLKKAQLEYEIAADQQKKEDEAAKQRLRQAYAEEVAAQYGEAAGMAAMLGESIRPFTQGGGRGGGGGRRQPIDVNRMVTNLTAQQARAVEIANDPKQPAQRRKAAAASVDAYTKIQNNLVTVNDSIDASLGKEFQADLEQMIREEPEKNLALKSEVEKKTREMLELSPGAWDKFKGQMTKRVINPKTGKESLVDLSGGLGLSDPNTIKRNAMVLSFADGSARSGQVKQILDADARGLSSALKNNDYADDPDLEAFAYQALGYKAAQDIAGFQRTREEEAGKVKAMNKAGVPFVGDKTRAISRAQQAAESEQGTVGAIAELTETRKKSAKSAQYYGLSQAAYNRLTSAGGNSKVKEYLALAEGMRRAGKKAPSVEEFLSK